MRKVMLTNNPRNRRMLVFQLSPQASSKEMPNKESIAIRYDREKSGVVRPRRVRLRIPPVIRLATGETGGPYPANVLRDKRLMAARRSGVVLVEYIEESPLAVGDLKPIRRRGKQSGTAND